MNKTFFNYIRHLSEQDHKTLSQKTLKVGEEFGELAKVALPYDNAHTTTHRFVERERILEEAVDVVLTAISIPYALGFTDEEVEQMFARKSEKWAQLQLNEADVKYPLPYEIHITVPTNDIPRFRNACESMHVKPIVIDLQDNTGASVMHDVMTSSKHFGDNRSVYEEARRLEALLSDNYNLEATRIKIETVPWHPAAPSKPGDVMPKDCYFESHIGVTLNEDELPVLRKTCNMSVFNLHASQNVFKRTENGKVVVMVTYRSYDGFTSKFKDDVTSVVDFLRVHGFGAGKPIVEFSVYDTKVSHDAAWLVNNK